MELPSYPGTVAEALKRKRRCAASLNTLPELRRVTLAVYTQRIG